jgi:hypothetical protein
MRRLLVNDDASGVGVSSAAAAAAEARARAGVEKHDSFLFRDSLLVRALVRAGVNEITRLTECAHAERSTLALEREWKSCERAAKQLFHSQ